MDLDKMKEELLRKEEDTGDQKEKGTPRKMSALKKSLIGVSILLGILLLIAGFFVIRFFSRIAKPGTYTFGEETEYIEETPEPDIVISPPSSWPETTTTPSAPTPTPLPTPEQGPLPLEEYYPQTRLSGEELDRIRRHNEEEQDIVNILVVGVDRRGTRGNSNADVVMVATLDKKNNRLKLTSLLRDLYVPIEDGAGRLNSAAAKGGMPLLINTVNAALRLNIKNYVLIDFAMFEKLINSLGGITVYMTSAEISAANDNIAGLNKQRGVDYLWDGFIFANAGNVKLTGKQALGYARIRKIDSDFKRTDRQFKVVMAILAKFRAQNLAKQLLMIDDVLPLVETDLSAMQIIDYAQEALSMDTLGLLHETVPMPELYKNGKIGGSFVFLFDMPATALKVHEFIYVSAEEPKEAKLLSPGKSLPPRTPSPTLEPLDEEIHIPEEDGDLYGQLGEEEIPYILDAEDIPQE